MEPLLLCQAHNDRAEGVPARGQADGGQRARELGTHENPTWSGEGCCWGHWIWDAQARQGLECQANTPGQRTMVLVTRADRA